MTNSAHDLGQILGAQIRAVLEAEAENAEAIADFITEVGFEKQEGEEGIGKLRMIKFDMLRRNEAGELETHTISIPLLSILPIPMLSIEKADFEFELKIHDVKKTTAATASVASRKFGKQIFASFAKSRKIKDPNRGTTTNQAIDSNMSIKVSVVQTDFPLGVEKLLNLSELGIADTIKK